MSDLTQWGDQPAALVGEVVLYCKSPGEDLPAIVLEDSRAVYDDPVLLWVLHVVGDPRKKDAKFSAEPKAGTWRFRTLRPVARFAGEP